MGNLIDGRRVAKIWIRPAWRTMPGRPVSYYPQCVIRDSGLTEWYALCIAEEARCPTS